MATESSGWLRRERAARARLLKLQKVVHEGVSLAKNAVKIKWRQLRGTMTHCSVVMICCVPLQDTLLRAGCDLR